jgi:late competence protein required for DNA uptake (superfamily II DNA/RNA helicase)
MFEDNNATQGGNIMNCSRCGRTISEADAFNHQGRPVCEDCMMDLGLSKKDCDPWATYVETADRKRHGIKGAENLSEMEQKIYEFVKAKGKTTREEVMQNFGLSEGDARQQLLPLMHSELVKERSEGSRQYLVAVG